jgi:hypothetical protein
MKRNNRLHLLDQNLLNAIIVAIVSKFIIVNQAVVYAINNTIVNQAVVNQAIVIDPAPATKNRVILTIQPSSWTTYCVAKAGTEDAYFVEIH